MSIFSPHHPVNIYGIYDTWSYPKLLRLFFCLEVVRTPSFCWLVCAVMIRHARKLVFTHSVVTLHFRKEV